MIEKIQKAFTKDIKGFSSFSYQERLSNLKIYSLQRRRERYIIIYVWKILENLVPNLVKPLQFYVSDRRGRLCSVSHVRLGHTGTLAYSSFRWKGIRLFNSLPMHIRNITASCLLPTLISGDCRYCCIFGFPKYTHSVCWWRLAISAGGPLICMSVSV